MEGWTDIMYVHMDAVGDYSSVYFLLLVLVGSFFLLNLILAVIMRSFVENDEREKLKLSEKRLKELVEKKQELQKIQDEAQQKQIEFRKLFKRSKSDEVSTNPVKIFPKLIVEDPENSETPLNLEPKSSRKSRLSNKILELLDYTPKGEEEKEKEKRQSIDGDITPIEPRNQISNKPDM